MKDIFILTDSFVKSLFDLDKNIRAATSKTLFLLEKNVKHPSLHVEKIFDDVYTARVGRDYRIVHQSAVAKIRMLYIGNHDDAYRFIERYRTRTTPMVHEDKLEYETGVVIDPEPRDIGLISATLLSRLVEKSGKYSGKYQVDRHGVVTEITLVNNEYVN